MAKNELTAAVLNENFDAAARSSFKISGEKLDEYCHVIYEDIDNIPEQEEPVEYAFTKKDLSQPNFDLSSFKPQKQLHPKVWPGGKLNSKIRLRLLDIADDFIDTLDVDWVKPDDIILTGSLANYNWSKYSDFDLHVLMDFKKVDERVDFVKNYFDSKKSLWNEHHENLKIYGFPVEVYVQDANEEHTASGIYSLEKNEWIKEPEPNKIKAIKLDKFMIKEKVFKFMKQIEKLEDEFERANDESSLEDIAKKAKALFDKIKGIRRESLKKGGEMSPGNIIYKCLRRFLYIKRLIDIKTDTYDKMYSIK